MGWRRVRIKEKEAEIRGEREKERSEVAIVASLEDGGGGGNTTPAKNAGSLEKTRKGKKTDSPLEPPPEGTQRSIF